MGLITKEVEVLINTRNIKHLESKGYEIPRNENKNGKLVIKKEVKILVKVEDLSEGSHVKVDVECDGCGKEFIDVEWRNCSKYIKENGEYYCQKCAKNKYKKFISFEQWCIENNRQDILNRWDYELNDYKPNEITFGTENTYYFKCPKLIHKSELKRISNITKRNNGVIQCDKCNSFAQWGIDNICEDFLEKYWDYEKNKLNPWEINYGSNNKIIYIKCQDKKYHESYDTIPNSFTSGSRCPYCDIFASGKVHPLDSLGKLLEDKNLLHLWSNKNKNSSYEYPPWSSKEVYWKCPEGKHKDYPRKISNSNLRDFRCPECQYSKGEERLYEIFNYINISYSRQYIFNDLLGIGGRLLKFDISTFWDKEQTKLRILIEHDGIQHFRPVRFGGISKERAIEKFKKQVENDIKKNLYCAKNNIQLIRIPYWEYDNIEKYLRYYLIENSEFDY